MNKGTRLGFRSLSLARQVRVVTVFLLGLVTMVSALVTGTLFLRWWRVEYERQVRASAYLAAELISQDIDRFRQLAIMSARMLSGELSRSVGTRYQVIFQNIREVFPDLRAVGVFSPEGERVFFAGEPPWEDVQVENLFSRRFASTEGMTYEVVKYPGERMSYLLVRYRDQGKRVVFVFSLASVLAHFSSQLRSQGLAMAVVDMNGSYVVHTESMKVFTSEGLGHLPGFHAFLQSGEETVWLSESARYEPMRYYLIRLKDLSWFVVVEMKPLGWLGFVSRFLGLILVFFVLALGIAVVIAVWFSDTLRRVFDFFVSYTRDLLGGKTPVREVSFSFEEMEFFVSTVEQLVRSLREEQENLRYSRQVIQEIVEALSEGLLIVRPDGKIVYLNPEGGRLLGVPPRTEINALVQGTGEGGFGIPLPLLMAIKPYERFYEVREEVMLYTAQGEKIWLLVQSQDWCHPDGRFLGKMVLLSDVTRRRMFEQELEVSRKRLSTALEAASAIVWDWLIPADTLLLSSEWEKKTGLELPVSFEAWLSQLPEEERDRVREAIMEYCNGKTQEFTLEHRLSGRNHQTIWVINRAHIIERDIFQQPLRVIGVMVDITTMKNQQAQIEHALAEKEVLLKEVHHRVKNNLQIISSLLSLQAESAPDVAIQRALVDSQVRVRSMALVHEKLYQSRSFSEVSLSEYLQDLTEAIRSIYEVGSQVELEVSLDEAVLPLERCIPLGLWFSEALTNALKYGVGGSHPRVRVVFQKRDEGFVLEVADNGPGIDGTIEAKSGSLGMKLLSILAEQLRGKVSFISQGGLCVRLEFPGS